MACERFHGEPLCARRKVPREPCVAQASEDLRLYLWDTRTLKVPGKRPSFASRRNFDMEIADVRDPGLQVAQTFDGMNDIPHCVDVSEDGKILASSHNGFSRLGCSVRAQNQNSAHGTS